MTASSNGIVADADHIAAEIDQTVTLLERVMADDYIDELLKPIEKKYGKRDFYFNGSQMLHRYSKNLSSRQIAAADKTHSVAYREADRMRHDELALAMAIMAERMLGWWD